MPSVLPLAGHPVRWRLLAELAGGDRAVRELAALVGERQNLVSYHLRLLRDGGLVTSRRSSADRRDSYYALDLAGCRDRLAAAGTALHAGLRLVPAPPRPPGRGAARPVRVLFVCTGNSARSRMAEAMLRAAGGDRVRVASAGSHPKPLHPSAVQVMRERGLDVPDAPPTSLADVGVTSFDRVITLCDKVREHCPELPDGPVVVHWSIPPPDGRDTFEAVADELETRVAFLLDTLDPPDPD
jgi:protein-tyrosine-phosphatase/DNA-binding transcriptional ArsR family regulator